MIRSSHYVAANLFLASLLIAPTAQAVVTSLAVSDTDIAVGENFEVIVSISDVFAPSSSPPIELLAFGFDVDVSSTVLSFTGGNVESPFNDNSGSFPGTDVAGSVFPGLVASDFTEPLALATLSFTAIGAGTSNIDILSNLSDLNEGLFYFMSNRVELSGSTSVNVRVAGQIPEPATFTLVGLGLAGIGYRRHRSKQGVQPVAREYVEEKRQKNQ